MYSLEEQIFKNDKAVVERLLEYGFKKEDNLFVYNSALIDDLRLFITYDDKFTVKVIDDVFKEEYLGYRLKTRGAYGNLVLNKVEEILIDIKNYCLKKTNYISPQANRLDEYMSAVYGKVEHTFKDDSSIGVYREGGSQKWYAIIMRIGIDKLIKDKSDEKEVEIINLKVSKKELPELLKRKGIFPAYHMNKQNWVSIILDDSLSDNEIIMLINNSYDLVLSGMNEKKYYRRPY